MQKDPWDYPYTPSPPEPAPEEFHPKAYRFIGPSLGEIIAGLVYLFLHMFILGRFLFEILWVVGFRVDLVTLNIIYFSVGVLFLAIAMRRYLKESFTRFRQYGISNLWVILTGFGLVLVLAYGLGALLLILAPDAVNHNQEAIEEIVRQSFFPALFMTVILAPILEELLFRGAIFAPLRKKNRILAYVVSVLTFAFLHIATTVFFGNPNADILLIMLLYIPPGLVFAWVYEKSGTIWAPIILHAVWNLFATLMSFLVLGGLGIYQSLLSRIL
ncbi:MAG: CPBP family intramembrane metalloprotease [Oscillospiraceae bacterium]|nr:CPBP family intramembrane metalloprotease [Oscillospiraceae bacterium]